MTVRVIVFNDIQNKFRIKTERERELILRLNQQQGNPCFMCQVLSKLYFTVKSKNGKKLFTLFFTCKVKGVTILMVLVGGQHKEFLETQVNL